MTVDIILRLHGSIELFAEAVVSRDFPEVLEAHLENFVVPDGDYEDLGDLLSTDLKAMLRD